MWSGKKKKEKKQASVEKRKETRTASSQPKEYYMDQDEMDYWTFLTQNTIKNALYVGDSRPESCVSSMII